MKTKTFTEWQNNFISENIILENEELLKNIDWDTITSKELDALTNKINKLPTLKDFGVKALSWNQGILLLSLIAKLKPRKYMFPYTQILDRPMIENDYGLGVMQQIFDKAFKEGKIKIIQTGRPEPGLLKPSLLMK